MILKEKLKEPIYFVYDITNYFIYCFTKSEACAHSVTLGIMDSDRALIPTDLQWVSNIINSFDLEKDNLQFCANKLVLNGERWLRHFPEEQLTEELLDKKKIAIARSKYIYTLESYIRTYITKSNYLIDLSTTAHLLDAIRTSNPEKNIYSMALMEYAHVLDIDYKAAYQELQVHTDSSGLLKVRAHAQYLKYVNIFNGCSTQEDLESAFKQMWKELCALCRI